MSRTATVLLVEDSPALREVVRDILTGAGYHVATAADAEQALAALATTPFDLVLTDALVELAVAKTDYWRVLQTLAAQAGSARLIIFTAHRASDFPDFRGRGFTAILPKPFKLDALIATVTAALLPRGEAAPNRREGVTSMVPTHALLDPTSAGSPADMAPDDSCRPIIGGACSRGTEPLGGLYRAESVVEPDVSELGRGVLVSGVAGSVKPDPPRVRRRPARP